ncbi:MAG: hypothetical protein WCC48_03205 [Anaeromyxobacteraceae bacterium]
MDIPRPRWSLGRPIPIARLAAAQAALREKAASGGKDRKPGVKKPGKKPGKKPAAKRAKR